MRGLAPKSCLSDKRKCARIWADAATPGRRTSSRFARQGSFPGRAIGQARFVPVADNLRVMLTERRIKVRLDAREILKRFKISATVKISLVKR